MTFTVLEYFRQISNIPRTSGSEAGIRQWLSDWANKRQLITKRDDIGNLLIKVPASQGKEDLVPIIIQSHMDMVCQKSPESRHDFTKDPIEFVQSGDWLMANGTTLGADNGVGMALMLYLAEKHDYQHPPIELLFTVEEEFGMTGADNLDPSLIQGKTLINLDSIEDAITIGCGGGTSTYLTLPLEWKRNDPKNITICINISGLLGGHSAEDIQKPIGNAIKLTARILDFIRRSSPIYLSKINGGSARNAIPRDAAVIFACSPQNVQSCVKAFNSITKDILIEYIKSEPEMNFSMVEQDIAADLICSMSETNKMIDLLLSLPNGVTAYSSDFPGIVETSNNIGIVELKDDGLHVVSNQRSGRLSTLLEITYRVEAIAQLANADIEKTRVFLPWQADYGSALLARSKHTYFIVFGKQPMVNTTHGGCECGLISGRCGGLDTISIGVTIEHLHSPDEKLFLPSIEPIVIFIKALLQSY